MTLPYDRSFNRGRQSEQFYNEELHQTFTALKNINYRKNENNGEDPSSILDGALWFDKQDNQLKYWDNYSKSWNCVFSEKFQITDQITNTLTPSNPVDGQLWIYNDILSYYDSTDGEWKTVKASVQDDSQWSSSVFDDYVLVSPLDPSNTVSTTTSQARSIYEGYMTLEERSAARTVFETSVPYRAGNNELAVTLNGIKLYNGKGFYESTTGGTKLTDDDNGTIHYNFVIVSALNIGDIVGWQIFTNQSEISGTSEEDSTEEYEETHKNTNYIESTNTAWSFTSPVTINVEPGTNPTISDNAVSRYLIPNVNSDRIFIDNSCDDSYTTINRVSIEYKTKDIYKKTLSAIHVNPGKITKITKRLIKIDKYNPTIEMSAYNTEFYGFRTDKVGGDFLIKSDSQLSGDFTTSDDCIILNEDTAQNYDYVLAITFEFTWVKSDGTLNRYAGTDSGTSYFVSNLLTPVSVHSNGVRLDESSFSVDASTSMVTLEENTDDVDVDIWSPTHKEYGYIRKIDMDNRGIIHLHKKIQVPLVFIGGALINPLTGGIDCSELESKGIIYVSNTQNNRETLLNMAWCVCDIAPDSSYSEYDVKQEGTVAEAPEELTSVNEDEVSFDDEIGEASILVDGKQLHTQTNGITNFLLATGVTESTSIRIDYDPTRLTEEDGLILFINGLLVCENDMTRDAECGYVYMDDLQIGDEYVLIRDTNGMLYKHTDISKAYSTGTLSESLVYLDGKLLANENCVATTNSPTTEKANDPVHNEVKLFIEDEFTDTKTWKIYNRYDDDWYTIEDDDTKDVTDITSGCINLLTTISVSAGTERFESSEKLNARNNLSSATTITVYGYSEDIDINELGLTTEGITELISGEDYTIDYTYNTINLDDDSQSAYKYFIVDCGIDEDDIVIYAFKFAKENSGNYKTGTGIYVRDDDDGLPIIQIGSDTYSREDGTLNVYKNGIKLIKGTQYKELSELNYIKLMYPLSDDDIISYIIEPLESGESIGHTQFELTNKNAISTNVYEIPDSSSYELYPGRVTVYVNGLRLSNSDWLILDNKHIMLKYNDYATVGSNNNYETETFLDGDETFEVTHTWPDSILVEIRKDYDRNEYTFEYSVEDGSEVGIADKGIPEEILDTDDEVLIYLNGQYTGLSRRTSQDYKLDKYKSCVSFLTSDFQQIINKDPLYILLNSDQKIYGAWKKMTGKDEYVSSVKNRITFVWR